MLRMNSMEDGNELAEVDEGETGRPGPLKAIRANCMACCNEQYSEVEKCHVPQCPLWPWRFGKRPETAARQGRLVDPAKFVCTCNLVGPACTGRG